MSVNFPVENGWVRCLHLTPRTGLETEHNHWVIPGDREMCIELKEGNQGINARYETLTESELSVHNQEEYAISEAAFGVFRDMAECHKIRCRFKQPIREYEFDFGEITVQEVRVQEFVNQKTLMGFRASIRHHVAYYFSINSGNNETTPLCLKRYQTVKDNRVVTKDVISREELVGISSDNIVERNEKRMTREMATCIWATFMQEERIKELRQQIPGNEEYFPQPEILD